ncbi:MAG TPA: pantetheine-phosphate adenylyltransferase [Candidatus Nanopelagicaceae bacterium]|nr:pantetheine-phosphate adenylyltransferase [Candidatus Nanopelagicaceae bacterium]
MHSAICPGSFDPITYGHLDIIERASALYDEVVVAVLVNQTKSSLFTVDERMSMIKEVTSQFSNVRVDSWSGLLVEYCKTHGIPAIVKGLRAVSDFEYELQMAQMNHQLAGIETVFISTSPQYSFLRSSLVKEIAKYGGDVSAYIPPTVLKRLLARLDVVSS